MAPRHTLISEVRPGHVDFKIKARVIRLWKVSDRINPNFIRSIELILLDEKRSKIQASVKANLFSLFQTILQEGCSYIIQNLLVAQRENKYRGSNHDFKLTFMRTTVCMKTDCPSIPDNFFDFVSFPTISSGVDETFLIDVIGHVVQRSDLCENNKNGVTNTIMDIVLEDLSGNRIGCTLWDDFANQFNSYIMINEPISLVVVVLQLCKMRLYSGSIGVSNSFNATRLFINDNLKEIIDYRTSLEKGNKIPTQSVSHVSGNSSKSFDDEFLKGDRMSILDIIEIDKACSGVVLAKIMDFDSSKGWYYEACIRCSKKVYDPVGRQFYCSNGAVIVQSVRRVKIHAQVIDSTGSAFFTLFDRNAIRYLEDSVDKLLEEDKGGNLSVWPNVFDVLLEKEMLFKVIITKDNIEKGWSTYTVRRCSADDSLIHQFKQLHEIKDDEDADNDSCHPTEVDDNIKVSPDKDVDQNSEGNLTEPDQINFVDVDDVPSDPNTPLSNSSLKRSAEDLNLLTSDRLSKLQSSTTKEPKFLSVKIEKDP